MPVATPSQTKLRRTAPPVAGTDAHAAARNSKKVNPPLHAPTSLGGKPPVAPPHTDAEKERQMYIDFKNDGGRCELTSFYKSRRSEYEEKHELAHVAGYSRSSGYVFPGSAARSSGASGPRLWMHSRADTPPEIGCPGRQLSN